MDRNPEAIMEEGKEEMPVKKIVNESFVREIALEHEKEKHNFAGTVKELRYFIFKMENRLRRRKKIKKLHMVELNVLVSNCKKQVICPGCEKEMAAEPDRGKEVLLQANRNLKSLDAFRFRLNMTKAQKKNIYYPAHVPKKQQERIWPARPIRSINLRTFCIYGPFSS
jgi:hypothetical protein